MTKVVSGNLILNHFIKTRAFMGLFFPTGHSPPHLFKKCFTTIIWSDIMRTHID